MKVSNVTWSRVELGHGKLAPKETLPRRMVAQGRTGAANGRIGGRLSGGKRAQKALRAAPRVKVVGAISKPSGGAIVGSGAPQAALLPAQLAAAAAAAQAMGQLLGLTPTRMTQASQVAIAAVAATQATGGAPALAATPVVEPQVQSSSKRKLPMQPPASAEVPFLQRKARAAYTPATALAGGKRGQLVVVQPSGQYGAGKAYGWDDVVAVGKLLQEGKIKQKTELDKTKPDGSLLYKVPRTTMNKWLKDDWCAPPLNHRVP